MEQNEEYLVFIKNEEESIIQGNLNKKMEAYISNSFEVVTHERYLILLLSLIDLDILKQSKLTDHEINIIKILP